MYRLIIIHLLLQDSGLSVTHMYFYSTLHLTPANNFYNKFSLFLKACFIFSVNLREIRSTELNLHWELLLHDNRDFKDNIDLLTIN